MDAIETEKIGEIYERKYKQGSLRIDDCDEQKQLLDWVLTSQENRDINILDAGCGSGKYSNYLFSKGFKKIYSIDLFERLPTINGVHYEKSPIDNTSFPDNYFSVVYSLSVIYYLNDPETGMKEFNRILKKGGWLMLTAHTKYSLFTLWRIVKRKISPKSVEHLKNVKFYSANEYCAMLDANGFDIEYVDGFRISILSGRIYAKIRRIVKKLLNIQLPCCTTKKTNYKFLRIVRSIFGYHSVMIGIKR